VISGPLYLLLRLTLSVITPEVPQSRKYARHESDRPFALTRDRIKQIFTDDPLDCDRNCPAHPSLKSLSKGRLWAMGRTYAESSARDLFKDFFEKKVDEELCFRSVTRVREDRIIEHWIIDTVSKVARGGRAIDLGEIFDDRATRKAVNQFLLAYFYVDSPVDRLGSAKFLETIKGISSIVESDMETENVKGCFFNLATHSSAIANLANLKMFPDNLAFHDVLTYSPPSGFISRLSSLSKDKFIPDLGPASIWRPKIDAIGQMFYQQLRIESNNSTKWFTQSFLEILSDYPSPLVLLHQSESSLKIVEDLASFGRDGGVKRLMKLKKKMKLSKEDLHLDEQYMNLIDYSREYARTVFSAES
jgi:hypothetical protein